MQASYNEADMRSLLSKVKIFNSVLGEYQMYAINSSFNYVIKLSNGSLYFTLDELEANEKDTLTPEMLQRIARRFDQESNQTADRQTQERSGYKTPAHEPAPAKSSFDIGQIVLIALVFFVVIGGIGLGAYLLNQPSPGTPYGDPTTENPYGSNYEEEPEPERPKTEAELRAELKEKEQNNPEKYITAEWTTREAVFFAQQIFEGRVYNHATATGFKNVRLRISGYSDTDYLLEKREYVLTKFIDAGDSQSFEWRTDIWNNDIDRFEVEFVSAELY